MAVMLNLGDAIVGDGCVSCDATDGDKTSLVMGNTPTSGLADVTAASEEPPTPVLEVAERDTSVAEVAAPAGVGDDITVFERVAVLAAEVLGLGCLVNCRSNRLK